MVVVPHACKSDNPFLQQVERTPSSMTGAFVQELVCIMMDIPPPPPGEFGNVLDANLHCEMTKKCVRSPHFLPRVSHREALSPEATNATEQRGIAGAPKAAPLARNNRDVAKELPQSKDEQAKKPVDSLLVDLAACMDSVCFNWSLDSWGSFGTVTTQPTKCLARKRIFAAFVGSSSSEVFPLKLLEKMKKVSCTREVMNNTEACKTDPNSFQDVLHEDHPIPPLSSDGQIGVDWKAIAQGRNVKKMIIRNGSCLTTMIVTKMTAQQVITAAELATNEDAV